MLRGKYGMNSSFWKGKKVLITGNTGFKGSWLSLWLLSMGANIRGYALQPDKKINLFNTFNLDNNMETEFKDIRDFENLNKNFKKFDPEIIFHMAAQPLVRYSYDNPLETYSVNIMGTANIMECIRLGSKERVFINITSDKCYENKEWLWGYREDEPMGGYDPYSSSKGCSELITSAYRRSYFDNKNNDVAIASVRSGNVIGGGDWSEDRLIPDFIRAISEGKAVSIRNPNAIRPWQFVLAPLDGYMNLAEKMFFDREDYCQAWNFGPEESDAKTVEWIINKIVNLWGEGASFNISKSSSDPHEANYLKLDCSKAKNKLNWRSSINLTKSLENICNWHKAFNDNEDIVALSLEQIRNYKTNLSNN
jgi:CDP-glucose 4,6-dehydratase